MKRNSNIDYRYIISCDIETSLVTPDNGDEIQVPYLNNILEMDITTGTFSGSKYTRTIIEMINYLNEISSEDRVRIVYAHNLRYEIDFIKNQFKASFVVLDDEDLNAYGLQKTEGVMRSTTDIVYCTLDCCPHIIFRDSNALFNTKLESMGKDLSKRLGNDDFIKLDYDYEKLRLPWDDLEEHDYLYNEMDNKIVLMSLYYFLKDRNLKMEDCPITSTGDVKKARKNYVVDNYTVKHLKQMNKNKHYSVTDYDFYTLVNKTYQGGFTGANYNYVNKLIKNVYSIDIKSSYPYQMVNNIFPRFDVETTENWRGELADEYYHRFLHGKTHKQLQGTGCVVKGYFARVQFTNIRIKNSSYLLDISESRCHIHPGCKKVTINGKIKSASLITMFVNNVDMDRILKLYECDDMYVYDLWTTSESQRLPQGEVAFILENFNLKESVNKDVNPVLYDLAKIRTNSMYGVKVQNEVKDFTTIENGEVKQYTYKNLEIGEYDDVKLTQEDVYNNVKDSLNKRFGHEGANFDIYSDGVYITSFARTMLMDMMVRLYDEGFDTVYSDTDSLKFKVRVHGNESMKKVSELADSSDINNKIYELVNKINNDIINYNMKNLRVNEFFNKKGKMDMTKIYALGTWEVESVNGNGDIEPYIAFKTLGAKKYCYYGWNKKANEHVIKTTVAGCKKESFATAIENYSKTLHGNDEEKRLQAMDYLFNPKTLVDESASGRTTATYEKRSYEECMKLTYNGRPLNSAGGIIISDTTYLLNLSEIDGLVLGENSSNTKWVRKININGDVSYNNESELA